MAIPQKNPSWLDALLAQAYPGVGTDMSAMTGVPQGRTGGAEINAPLGGWTAPGADNFSGGGGIGSDVRFPSVNVDPRLLPVPVGGQRNPYSPPVPSPRNVGGAPAPGIPAPVGANRTANNPPANTFQYAVPNSSASRAPIYTAGNFSGLFGGGAPHGNPSATPPAGALSAPQGGYNVNSLFQNLPNDIFNNSPQPSMNQQGMTGTPIGPSPSALPQAQKYGWPFNMIGS